MLTLRQLCVQDMTGPPGIGRPPRLVEGWFAELKTCMHGQVTYRQVGRRALEAEAPG